MPPVRILLDYRPALRERTGVGEYVHEMAKALVRTAPDEESLTLFSSSWKDRLRPDVLAGAGVVDRQVPVRLLNLMWHRLEWPGVEQLTGQQFDVAASLHPLLLPAAKAARVVTIHDLDFLDHPERVGAEIQRDYPGKAANHARRADQIVVVSEHTASEVRRRFDVPRSKITISSPGGPSWPMRPSEPATGVILFLGTLEPRKNLEVLVTAYEALVARRPSAPTLVLAGRATPQAEPLIERVRRSAVADRVRFPGYIHPDQRLDLFNSALVFVLPSHHEGFGMPAVEAMTAGVPVIAANRGALPEALGGAGRLVDPNRPDELTHALEYLLDHPDERRRMAVEGRKQAERYTWTDTARRYREALSLAIEHRHARG